MRDVSVVSKPRSQTSADCGESRLNHGDREQSRRSDLDRELSRVDLPELCTSDDSVARRHELSAPALAPQTTTAMVDAFETDSSYFYTRLYR